MKHHIAWQAATPCTGKACGTGAPDEVIGVHLRNLIAMAGVHRGISLASSRTPLFMSLLVRLFVKLIGYTEEQVRGKCDGTRLADSTLVDDICNALVLVKDVNGLETQTNLVL